MRQIPVFRFARVSLIMAIGSIAGCGSVHYGTYPDGLTGFPELPISADKAVEAAQPYLDKTFALCRASRGSNWPESEPRIRVMLEGKTYKVLKDNYPSMNAHYGFDHAVKVDAETGEVTPPKSSD
jgi:hypothetical protein